MALKGFKNLPKWLKERKSLKQCVLTSKIAQKGLIGKNQRIIISCLLSWERVPDDLEGHGDESWKRTGFFRILADWRHGGWAPSLDGSHGEVAVVRDGIGGGGGTMGRGLILSVGIPIGIGFRKRQFLQATAPESSFT